MNWKIGQKVVCIEGGTWGNRHTLEPNGIGPEKNEIVTVSAFDKDGFLHLDEYPPIYAFDPSYFRPLLGQSAKDELISSFKEVTETSDMPIRKTETV